VGCGVSGVDGVLNFKLKIARKLSTARSCALQLSGVLYALTAMKAVDDSIGCKCGY